MPVDLHLHSSRSDGTDSPTRLIELASEAGLSAIALTDHDTQAGIEEAETAGERHGVRVVPGVELSCQWPGGTCHMLALFLEPGEGPLQDQLEAMRDERNTRNLKIIDRLRQLDMAITWDEVVEEAGGAVIGRPHFASVMVAKGIVPDNETAFDRYLARGRPGYAGRERIDPVKAIQLALASQAVPVLAHPHTLEEGALNRLPSLLGGLADAGLVGVEACYSSYTPDERSNLETTVRRLGLLPSGGSDHHGDNKPGQYVGVGRGDLVVPESMLDDLEAARNR